MSADDLGPLVKVPTGLTLLDLIKALSDGCDGTTIVEFIPTGEHESGAAELHLVRQRDGSLFLSVNMTEHTMLPPSEATGEHDCAECNDPNYIAGSHSSPSEAMHALLPDDEPDDVEPHPDQEVMPGLTP